MTARGVLPTPPTWSYPGEKKFEKIFWTKKFGQKKIWTRKIVVPYLDRGGGPDLDLDLDMGGPPDLDLALDQGAPSLDLDLDLDMGGPPRP